MQNKGDLSIGQCGVAYNKNFAVIGPDIPETSAGKLEILKPIPIKTVIMEDFTNISADNDILIGRAVNTNRNSLLQWRCSARSIAAFYPAASGI